METRPRSDIEEEIAAKIREYLPGADGEADSRTIAAALSPLLNRVREEGAAKALREAAESSQAKMFSPAVYVGPRRLKLGIGVREWLNDCADAVEQNSEGNEA